MTDEMTPPFQFQLSDFQTLMDSYDRRHEARHTELLQTIKDVETRVRHLETREAGRVSIFTGVKTFVYMIAAALIGAVTNMWSNLSGS